MALIAVASAKGSPGTTTLALAVAALWPRPVLLADCDPAGGDVALRMPGPDGSALDADRGLVSLAAVARRGLHPDQVGGHVQAVAGGLDVLAGVGRPEQAQAGAGVWRDLGGCLDSIDGIDVVADCGRLGGGLPTGRGDVPRPDAPGVGIVTPVLAAARLVVLVCRPEVTSVVHLRDRLAVLNGVLRPEAVDGVPIAVVVVARPDDRSGPAGVRDVLAREYPHVRVVGQVADDPKGAAFFNGTPGRRAARTLLVRSARDLTTSLAGYVEPFFVPGPGLAAATRPAPALEPSPTIRPEPAPRLTASHTSAPQLPAAHFSGPGRSGAPLPGPPLFDPRHAETPLAGSWPAETVPSGSRSVGPTALTPAPSGPPIAPSTIAAPPPPPGENWFAVERGPDRASDPTWDRSGWNGAARDRSTDDLPTPGNSPDRGTGPVTTP